MTKKTLTYFTAYFNAVVINKFPIYLYQVNLNGLAPPSPAQNIVGTPLPES